MADDGPFTMQTKITNKIRGTYQPSPNIPIEKNIEAEKELIGKQNELTELDSAFEIISRFLDRGHHFNTGHLNTGARLIQTRHSPEEIAWQEEIAKSIQKRPLWQCYAGWFRYCHENGMAQSPLFDPAWSQMQEFDPLMATCSLPSCSQQFRQERLGQRYCSKEHGAQADKEQIESIIASRPSPEVAIQSG